MHHKGREVAQRMQLLFCPRKKANFFSLCCLFFLRVSVVHVGLSLKGIAPLRKFLF